MSLMNIHLIWNISVESLLLIRKERFESSFSIWLMASKARAKNIDRAHYCSVWFSLPPIFKKSATQRIYRFFNNTCLKDRILQHRVIEIPPSISILSDLFFFSIKMHSKERISNGIRPHIFHNFLT